MALFVMMAFLIPTNSEIKAEVKQNKSDISEIKTDVAVTNERFKQIREDTSIIHGKLDIIKEDLNHIEKLMCKEFEDICLT